MNADVLCLQEVEPAVFQALEEALSPTGFAGRFLQKRAKPDGCAIFVHGYAVAAWKELTFADDSGHVALTARIGGRTIATTHIKWDPKGTPLQQRYAYRQTQELLAQRPDVLCGDFNFEPEDEVARILRAAGLREAFDGVRPAATFAGNDRPRKIDYLFHAAELRAVPDPVPALRKALPSAAEPSDHLPLVATVEEPAW